MSAGNSDDLDTSEVIQNIFDFVRDLANDLDDDQDDHDDSVLPEIIPLLFTDLTNAAHDPTIPSIHSLNDDCLDTVFSWLDLVELIRIRGVCRRWYTAAHSAVSRIDRLDLYKLSRRHDYYRDKATMPGCTFKRETTALPLLRFTQGNVKHLVLVCKCDIGSEKEALAVMVTFVSMCCPNLEILDLSKIDLLEGPWYDYDEDYHNDYTEHEASLYRVVAEDMPGTLALSHLLERVKHVKLYSYFAEKCLNIITENARNLEAIDFGRCTETTGEFITRNLGNNGMKYFNFRGCNSLLPDTLEFILKNYSSTIEFLDLSCELSRMTDFCENNIGPFLNMTEFHFGGINRRAISHDANHGRSYSPWSEFFFFQQMPNLKVLHLEIENEDFRDDPLRYLSHVADMCPNIEELDICNKTGFEDKLEPLARFKYLKKLGLYGVEDGAHLGVHLGFRASSNINKTNGDILFSSVLVQLKTLQFLRLYWFILDDQNLYDIISNGTMLSRLYLCYSYFDMVTGTFIEMSKTLHRTRKLEIVLPKCVWDKFSEELKENIPSFLTFRLDRRKPISKSGGKVEVLGPYDAI